jgi:hypothetical protein
MPGIASSVTGSTSSTSWQPAASQQTRCGLAQDLAAAVDGGRPRPPEAVKDAGRESGRGRPDDGHGAGPTHANAGGLVLCAKSVRAQVGADADGAEWRASDALGLRFPSPELVTSAASLFEQAQPWAVGSARRGTEPESGRFRLTVGPGVVRLGSSNPVRKEKAAQRALERHDVDIDGWQIRVKDLLGAASWLDAPAEVAVAQCRWGGISPGRTGRQVTQWSRKSPSAMCRTFAELDYTPLVESGRVPAMVTLTYPGDWEKVAPDGASVKPHMVLWRKRFHREYGESAR